MKNERNGVKLLLNPADFVITNKSEYKVVVVVFFYNVIVGTFSLTLLSFTISTITTTSSTTTTKIKAFVIAKNKSQSDLSFSATEVYNNKTIINNHSNNN